MSITSRLLRACLWLSCLPAQAMLGGDISQLPHARSAGTGELVVQPYAHYSRYDYHNPQGVSVHEFADVHGRIFALSWQGAAPLPLRQVLGSYASELQNVHRRHPDHHRFDLVSPDLVLHSRSYLRQFSGYAYLPGQWPAQVPNQALSLP